MENIINKPYEWGGKIVKKCNVLSIKDNNRLQIAISFNEKKIKGESFTCYITKVNENIAAWTYPEHLLIGVIQDDDIKNAIQGKEFLISFIENFKLKEEGLIEFEFLVILEDSIVLNSQDSKKSTVKRRKSYTSKGNKSVYDLIHYPLGDASYELSNVTDEQIYNLMSALDVVADGSSPKGKKKMYAVRTKDTKCNKYHITAFSYVHEKDKRTFIYTFGPSYESWYMKCNGCITSDDKANQLYESILNDLKGLGHKMDDTSDITRKSHMEYTDKISYHLSLPVFRNKDGFKTLTFAVIIKD